VKLYWSFARAIFANAAVFRFEFWMRFVSLGLLMYALNRIWTVLFTQRPGAFGVSLEQMVTYGVLGVLMRTLLDIGPEWYLAEQVRTGKIDTDLMKPVDFHAYLMAMASGELLFNLGVLVIPGLLLAYFLLGVQFPPNPATAAMFIVSTALGFLVMFHIAFLLGSLSVVTLDIRSFAWAYYSLVEFFAGSMLPLWLFPQLLQRLASLMPFQGIYYIPMSIYVGTLEGSGALRAIGLQALWVVVLIVFARWAWVRVHRRLVVQGG
jgi:ABC-2 type transport system permease protein